MSSLIRFDQVWDLVRQAVEANAGRLLECGCSELVLVRDLWGRVRLIEAEDSSEPQRAALQALAEQLESSLGAHAYLANEARVMMTGGEIERLRQAGRRLSQEGLDLILVERLVVGGGWSHFAQVQPGERPQRFTFFALKGGVGRSTAAAVLGAELARKARRVLLVDLDLESPGLSSLLLEADEFPDFGVTDWFVEDLVGQGDAVVRRMTARPAWAQDFVGELMVAPANGQGWREYVEKLGRVYLHRPPETLQGAPEPWPQRLQRLIASLEKSVEPDVTLIDSRNGLHDIAAAAVTSLGAQVLLFAVDNRATWEAYRALFEHWREAAAATKVRENLKVVAAMIPEGSAEDYLQSFRECSWHTFRDTLYDEISEGGAEEDLFSFDLKDETGPHWPIEIYWHGSISRVASLRDLQQKEPVIHAAYDKFLIWFDQLLSSQ